MHNLTQVLSGGTETALDQLNAAKFLSQRSAAHERRLIDTAGVVFEGRDRAGQLRAIFGGGRYDRLLSTFGGQAQPCAGFGFGDCVIMELLQDKGLVPQLPHKARQLCLYEANLLKFHAIHCPFLSLAHSKPCCPQDLG